MEALTREQVLESEVARLTLAVRDATTQLAACEQRLVAMREQFKSSSTDEENTLRKQLLELYHAARAEALEEAARLIEKEHRMGDRDGWLDLAQAILQLKEAPHAD